MENQDVVFDRLQDAADYCHVTKQAIYVAIRKGHLRGHLIYSKGMRGIARRRWSVSLTDLDDYRKNKYSREKSRFEGEKIFDVADGKFTVEQVSKILTQMVGYVYPNARVYYLLRTGQLKAFRRGRFWVVTSEALIECSEKEKNRKIRRKDITQLRFA